MARVRFRWKDYRANNKCKVMTLDADEFIRRFLLHTLPKGFRRIRHFGFLANACRANKLARIRNALNTPQPAPAVEPADYRERYAILTGHRIDLCPVCAGRMVEIGRWPRSASPPRPPLRTRLIEPCLPTPAEKPPSGPGWLHEIKHDGYRLMARRDGAGVRLLTRNGCRGLR
jgi:ATP-dependent DNA ligase